MSEKNSLFQIFYEAGNGICFSGNGRITSSSQKKEEVSVERGRMECKKMAGASIEGERMAEGQEQIDETLDTRIIGDSLPLEIVEKILQRLPHLERLRMERVCRKWRQAGKNSWRDINSLCLSIQDELQCKSNGFTECVEPRPLVEADNYEIRIKTTDLQIIRNSVMRIGRTVKKFIFEDNRYNSMHDNNRDILSIINEYCHNIEKMQLEANSQSLDKRVVSQLLETNTKLDSIESIEPIIELLPIRNWKRLLIDKFEYLDEDERDVAEGKLVALIKASPSLATFEMCNCSPNIIAELSKCRELRRLRVQVGRLKSVEEIYDVPMLNRLTVLFIDNYSCEAMTDILSQCINLRILSVSNDEYGDEDEEVIDEFIANVLRPPKLKALRIGYEIEDNHLISLTKFKHLSFTASDVMVTETGLLQLIRRSEQLETLDIREISWPFTPSFFKTIVKQRKNRTTILEIEVPADSYLAASEICRISNIKIVRKSIINASLYKI